ncbi:MAG TPA: OpgC domain-containing protein, partial [Archangium sp.]|nr:OpgC domain-containing protein [Archangium sp.]
MSENPPSGAAGSERDLRIDFLRGLVMLVLVVIHLEVVSLLTFLAWERVGLISGGEGFVILSGVVLGMVSRKRVETQGWAYSVSRLVDRAVQLYRVNVAIVISIALLSLVPLLDTTEVRSFTDRFADKTWPLFPALSEGFYTVVGRVLLLRAGP